MTAMKALIEAAERAQLLLRGLTISEVMERGIEAINAAGLNPYCINEGRASGRERISTDWLGAAIASAKTAEEETKWIEITEGCEMPEHGQNVICVCDWGVCLARCYVDFDNKVKFGQVTPGCGNCPNVTHWQPLPAPPVTREKEGL